MQIERIKTKLQQLKESDTDLVLFGAESHTYTLHTPLSIEEIRAFESENEVKLPEDYVLFLTQMGNGGAGPFYGIFPLQESRINLSDNAGNVTYFNLSQPFPHTEAWNVEEELAELYDRIEEAYEAGDEELEEKLFDEKWDLIGAEEHDYGRLYIADYGCGVYISLIVNGDEKGNIWTDDRTNDAGLYPSLELRNTERICFLDWYERWLDNSLEELNSSVNKN
ncbi:SMI1/KNR4 family protein [Sphingobacterium spiritivorum]|uniref:SMI1/KNR4 family protein n=1 Tax=Sphingobacterium spiritivorum TaxID=258 RepID=UPI003DA28E2D